MKTNLLVAMLALLAMQANILAMEADRTVSQKHKALSQLVIDESSETDRQKPTDMPELATHKKLRTQETAVTPAAPMVVAQPTPAQTMPTAGQEAAKNRIQHLLQNSKTTQALRHGQFNATLALMHVLLCDVNQDETNIAIDICIKEGAKLNEKEKLGKHGFITPLMLAAKKGNLDAVIKLLALGADRRITDSAGRTAYSHARENNRVAILKYFEDREDIMRRLQAAQETVASLPILRPPTALKRAAAVVSTPATALVIPQLAIAPIAQPISAIAAPLGKPAAPTLPAAQPAQAFIRAPGSVVATQIPAPQNTLAVAPIQAIPVQASLATAALAAQQQRLNSLPQAALSVPLRNPLQAQITAAVPIRNPFQPQSMPAMTIGNPWQQQITTAQTATMAIPAPMVPEITELNAPVFFTRLFEFAAAKAATGQNNLLLQVAACARGKIRIAAGVAIKKDDVAGVSQLMPFLANEYLNKANALLLALENKALRAAKLLIEKGVDVDVQNAKGQTALMIVTEKANSDRDFYNFFSWLYTADADATLRDGKGLMFLDYADKELMKEMPGWALELKHLMKEKTA